MYVGSFRRLKIRRGYLRDIMSRECLQDIHMAFGAHCLALPMLQHSIVSRELVTAGGTHYLL